MQTDPIGDGDGPNWYNYAGSDPVNATDPSGTCTGTHIDTQCDSGGIPIWAEGWSIPGLGAWANSTTIGTGVGTAAPQLAGTPQGSGVPSVGPSTNELASSLTTIVVQGSITYTPGFNSIPSLQLTSLSGGFQLASLSYRGATRVPLSGPRGSWKVLFSSEAMTHVLDEHGYGAGKGKGEYFDYLSNANTLTYKAAETISYGHEVAGYAQRPTDVAIQWDFPWEIGHTGTWGAAPTRRASAISSY